MTDPTCIIEERGQACGRPCWDQAYMCQLHGDGLAKDLGKVAGYVEEMDAVRSRQVVSTERVGTVATKDVPLPYDARVADVEDVLTNTLTTWARLIAEERGVPEPVPYGAPDGPRCGAGIGCKHRSCAAIRAQDVEAPATAAARWLIDQIQWVRHQRTADEAYDEIHAAILSAEQVVDTRPQRLYLGPCGGQVDADEQPLPEVCQRDIYAPLGKEVVTCPSCLGQHHVSDRRAWIKQAMEKHKASAGEISAICWAMFGDLVTTAMIRGYARSGAIQRQEDVLDRRGKYVPGYFVGDVMAHVRAIQGKKAAVDAARASARGAMDDEREARLANAC